MIFQRKGRDRTPDPNDAGRSVLDGATTAAFLDTVHLCPVDGETDDERIVRPCLAILFRLAVGPAADYYAPRFLEYERIGRSFPSRVRAVLGALIPELAGRWVLLAPALDRDERVHWMCIPVGIPVRYLPQACRQG